MPKYSKDIIEKISGLVSQDTYTIPEICKQVGISECTYHQWKIDHPEFSEAIKKATEKRLETFAAEAKKSLLKKITGYTVEETRTVFVDSGKKKGEKSIPKVKEKTIITKHYQPDTAAIIFTLTNREPDDWKNRQSVEATGKNGRDLFPQKMKLIKDLSIEEAAELISDK